MVYIINSDQLNGKLEDHYKTQIITGIHKDSDEFQWDLWTVEIESTTTIKYEGSLIIIE